MIPLKEDAVLMDSNLKFLPTDGRNLVVRAAELLRSEYGIRDGVQIHLHKTIPIAAGMAGGSTDAAATLVGMNRLFSLGISKTRLMEYGAKLGADIPFCILRGTALAEGIGEILTPLPDMPDCYILIAKPAVNVSTKFVYERLDCRALQNRPDVDGMLAAIHAGNYEGITSRLSNVLEEVTIAAFPVIEELKTAMLHHGADNALMSGSGSTVFGLFHNKANAEQAAAALRQNPSAKRVFLTKPFRSNGKN